MKVDLDIQAVVNDVIYHAREFEAKVADSPRAAMAHAEKLKALAQSLHLECWHSYHTSGVGPV